MNKKRNTLSAFAMQATAKIFTSISRNNMKNLVFTSCMCALSMLSFSQEKAQSTTEVKPVTTENSEKPKFVDTGNPEEDNKRYNEAKTLYIKQQEEKKNDPSSPDYIENVKNQLTQIESHLNSIRIKEEYILNNPEEKKVAEETGWFESMKTTKESLNLKKAELIKILEQAK